MKNKLSTLFISLLLTFLVIFCLSSCESNETENQPSSTSSTNQSQTVDSQGNNDVIDNGETGNTETGNTETGNTETGNTETGNTETGTPNDNEKSQAIDLMSGYTSGTTKAAELDGAFINNQWRLAMELFKSSNKTSDGNVLISPLSIQLALAMTANGAEGETKSQMERLLGGEYTIDELNAYLKTYVSNLPNEKSSKLNVANSIWFRKNNFVPNQLFLQTNKDYYDASIYSAPFDKTTLADINNWVNTNTDGMIKEMLNQIDESSLMYLINAIAFDAEWDEKYSEDSIHKDLFTMENGISCEAEFMWSTEYAYYELDNAVGFKKDYKNGKYSFVALLPNVGVSVNELVDLLSYEEIINMLNNPDYSRDVMAKMPKFSYEYSLKMNDVLSLLGMERAFDESEAEFDRIGQADGNIFIGSVLHKTFISVDEAGTKAGAATIVEVKEECESTRKEIEIVLDRPFMYMIIDNETLLPVFIGTLTSVE